MPTDADLRAAIGDILLAPHDLEKQGQQILALIAEQVKGRDDRIHLETRCDPAGDVARLALQTDQIAQLEARIAEQVKDYDVRGIMLKVVPDQDGNGHEVYAVNVEQVEAVLTELSEQVEKLQTDRDDWKRTALNGDKNYTLVMGGYVKKIRALQDFKDFTHRTLDSIGVPVELPESEHTKAGCRIGGRLEWVKDQLELQSRIAINAHVEKEKLQAQLAEAERRVEALDQVCVDALTSIAEIATKLARR